MVRLPCCDKLNVKKGIWTAEEDAKILAYVSKHGTGNWTAVPKKAGLRRCGKSCRLRWTNYLRPDLRHESFTPEEEELIIRLHATIGSRWSIIAQQLPGRTDNDVKNYWNTKLKKKLCEMGIDHVTHRPFSQILADYGNMGGLQKSGSLKRDLKNASSQKFEHYQPRQGGFSSINSHFMATTTLSPQVEPIQDSFFNNSSNNPMELLAQLQAIKLVTEASNYTNNETITPHFINEGSLSSSPSSSSSTCSTAVQTSFSWRDFLLDDAFLPNDQENMAECSSNDFTSQTQSLIPQNQFINEATGKENIGVIGGIDFAVPNSTAGFQTSSSSQSPFVDAIIEQENQMLSEFLDLLEQPLKY